MDERAGEVMEGGTDLDGDEVFFAEFDTAVVQDFGAAANKREHFVIGNLVEFFGIGEFAGVFVIHAVDIGADQTAVCVQEGGKCDSGRIRAASTECGDIFIGIDALKACNQYDFTLRQFVRDAFVLQAKDMCASEISVGQKSCLPTR